MLAYLQVFKKFPYLPAVLSGLLLGSTTIGRDSFYLLHGAVLFGFVPLWAYWLRETDRRKTVLSGWIFQFTFSLAAFHWLAHTVNEFGHLGMPLSVLVMLAYCTIANLQFPLAAYLWHRFFRSSSLSPSMQIAALALLTAVGMRLGTTVFHWHFGYAWLFLRWPAFQIADVVGFKWLCTFSLCLNGFLLAAWMKRKTRGWALPLALGITAFAAVNAFGLLRLHQLSPPDASLRVLLIQPNVGNREKEMIEHKEDYREISLQKYFDLTDRALKAQPENRPPDFVMWPENAVAGLIADAALSLPLSAKLKSYLASRKIALVTGGFGLSSNGKITNALFSLSNTGVWDSPPYHKMILLPFGEYVPGAERYPVLKQWFPDVRDYGRGDSPVLLTQNSVKLGPQICYEGLFDFLARDLAIRGAQVLVNVTNDSWYGNWMEPWQHFYITMAKAVENRLPLLRDTNTGLSAVIYANGHIPEISPISTEWFAAFDVPYRRELQATPFQLWGYWFDWMFLGTGLLGILSFRLRHALARPGNSRG